MSALQPHRKRYWLTPPADDPVALAEQICTVCEVYQAAPMLHEQALKRLPRLVSKKQTAFVRSCGVFIERDSLPSSSLPVVDAKPPTSVRSDSRSWSACAVPPIGKRIKARRGHSDCSNGRCAEACAKQALSPSTIRKPRRNNV